MAALDGWPSARFGGCTEPGLQAGSPAASPDESAGMSGRGGAVHVDLFTGGTPVTALTRLATGTVMHEAGGLPVTRDTASAAIRSLLGKLTPAERSVVW